MNINMKKKLFKYIIVFNIIYKSKIFKIYTVSAINLIVLAIKYLLARLKIIIDINIYF